MPVYAIPVNRDLDGAWTKEIDDMRQAIKNVPALLNMIVDEAILPALARNYGRSGIKSGGLRTGKLFKAVTMRGATGNMIEVEGTKATVSVDYAALPYAKYVLEGRGPVRPKKAKVLRWVDPDSGQVIFSKYSRPAPAHDVYYLTEGDLARAQGIANAAVIAGPGTI